jgi:hypothetical protein
MSFSSTQSEENKTKKRFFPEKKLVDDHCSSIICPKYV